MKTLASGAAASAFWAFRHHTSDAVDRWDPPSLPGNSDGPVYARYGGDGDGAVVLLHGLVSSGDLFGSAYDQLAATHRVVVPDLLGFGRSLDESRATFTVTDHLDALDQLAERAGLFGRRWTIGAHSMGSALALHWAARHRDRVERVICWGAPIYPSPDAARRRISGSAMTRLFVLDTRWAERACAISCRHRSAGGWLTAAVQPGLPIPVARAVSLHTWPAYRDAMRHFVIEADWKQLIGDVADHGIQVRLTYGSDDKVGDHTHADAMSRAISGDPVTLVPGADHHLPMSQPDSCLAEITLGDDRAGP
jgi:pimeloyl-ACP methyl ester carboxylesterase